MNLTRTLVSLSLLPLAGCESAYDREGLTQMQSRGVPAAVVQRVASHRPLRPAEVVTMTRRGVPPETLVRYIQRHGVDYLLTPADSRYLRQNGVDVRVLDALVAEGAEFSRDYGSRSRLSAGLTINDPYQSYADPNGFEW